MFYFFVFFFFFFSSRRRHTRLVSDWSSDVCSSDLRWRQSPMPASASPSPQIPATSSVSETQFAHCLSHRPPLQQKYDCNRRIVPNKLRLAPFSLSASLSLPRTLRTHQDLHNSLFSMPRPGVKSLRES